MRKEGADTTNIDSVFNNKGGAQITDLSMLVAVQKYLKLQLNPASGTQMTPNSAG